MNKIFIITHKDYLFPQNNIYKPLLVGAYKNKLIKCKEYYKDNVYDNISEKNENYCELTGLYWLWKNIFKFEKEITNIGLVHYRRYFINKNNKVISEEEIDDILKDNDIILPEKRYTIDGNNYNDYGEHHFIKDLDECKKIIDEKYPEYSFSFDKIMNRNYLYPFNMFIMKYRYLNDYCSWLFDILFELEQNITTDGYDKYQKRIFGFLAERLFNIWIDQNCLKIKELKVHNVEKNKLVEKIDKTSRKVISNSKFFKYIINRIKRKGIKYKYNSKNLKVMAIYLPAFHKEKLNDIAWGENFTEWDNVKAGKPLYKGHNQPLIPLNKNYYDLSNASAIKDQITIAKRYDVDGFILYHYWFGNGKMALETPAKIIKDNINIDFKYCFCWANHTWAKTWKQNKNEIIAKQEYCDEEDWIKHINYFIPYFKDKRYLKINDKPVIYIYNMSEIKNFDKMVTVWNRELKKAGLNSVFIIEFISSKNKHVSSLYTNSVVEFEPLYTTFFDISKFNLLKRFICKKMGKIDFQNYKLLTNKIIKRKRKYNGLTIQKGFFSAWDNSARKGQNAMIIKDCNPLNFKESLKKLLENNRMDAINFVVINAWNEWSEGAILEPTEEYEYKYLEAIKEVKDEYKK